MSSATDSSYASLATKLREVSALEGISGLLGWDEMVMLPSESSSCRGEQKAALAGVIYDKKTDAALGALLSTLSEEKGGEGLNEVQKAVIRDAAKSYKRETCLPRELATRIAELETEGYNAWIEARSKADFSIFAPVLQEWLDISLKKAELVDPEAPAYDVLLDSFEKGMTGARLDEIFAEVRAGLVPLLSEVRSKGTPPDTSLLKGKFNPAQQAMLCESIALDLGFDLSRGRLDVSVHPFTGGTHPTDVRMTTRFKEEDITEGLTGAIHETGHSLYEQGRNLGDEWKGLPVSSALSMGVHESQSLLWERMVALSPSFQPYLLRKLRHFFPETDMPWNSNKEGNSSDGGDDDECTARALYEALNLVREPSMIRVESDELTYTLHVLLRYELERALVDGSLKVADVPKAWNEKMVAYLGCEPESDARGVLQDVHWSAGALGYFPTYSLGAMFACQIFQAAKESIGAEELDAQLRNGEFSVLREWLRERVHLLGSLPVSGDELMKRVTGRPLDPQVFLRYLSDKYRTLYKC